MRLVTALVVTGVLAASGDARAQEQVVPPQDSWGTRWSTITTANAWSFAGPMTDVANGYRRCAAATGVCRASADLPGGTRLWALELEACDSSSTTEAVGRMWACYSVQGGTCAVVGEVRSGIAAAPGCGRFFAPLPYPYLQVRNWHYTYFVEVLGTDGAGNVPVDFRGLRLVWTREVAPAPATATFSDVPVTHPYFRHIEALAQALIVAGCGNDQYCPDRALTRGEMAVLLAEALGVHFPD
jgi:hypothetical protein